MKRILLLSLLVVALPSLAQAADPAPAPAAAKPAKSADPNKPMATVNGVVLPTAYGEIIRQSRGARGASPEAMTDDSIRDALINVELLSQEAMRKGLDKNPKVSASIEFQKKELLGQAAIEEYVLGHPISEDTIKAEYEAAKAKTGENEYRARHILVPTEKEAKEIIAKLTAKKAKFEDLAKKQSKDTSAGNGGDLGWALPANLVPEFAKALVALKKGETTKEPVQTQFGWHVIQLEDVRKLDFPTYDKLKSRIGGQLQQQQIRKFVQELRATAKID